MLAPSVQSSALVTLALTVASSPVGASVCPEGDSCLDADHHGNLLQVHNQLSEDSRNKARTKVRLQDWYDQCVTPFQEEGYGLSAGPPFYLKNSSNYGLYEQRSFLCSDSLSCAYKECVPPARCPGLNPFKLPFVTPSAEEFTANLRACPPDNLPAYTVKAETVADVVGAVDFAKKRGLKVSVKTSGHSYTGSSTFVGSVSINMRSYTKYSKYNTFECKQVGLIPRPLSVHEQEVCKVAEARGKHAVARVGGGETWNEVYSAVTFLPSPEVQYRYHVVGGAAGTVSAVGGWLQGGGLAGSTGMRLHGFGVDNVLEMEMVLSSGKHVRFWPSKWEEEGKLYPQTTKVTGECNENPVAEEEQWQWRPCTSLGLDITFQDLWFAVRGGGGGTFGVVTSVYYQLHHQLEPLEPKEDAIYGVYKLPPAVSLGACYAQEQCADFLRKLWLRYARDWFFPEAKARFSGVSKFCGASATHPLDFFYLDFGVYWCVGRAAAAAMLGAWSTFVDEAKADLAKLGFGPFDILGLKTGVLFESGPYPTYYAFSMSTSLLFPRSMQDFTTQLPDLPTPATYPDNLIGTFWPALLPFEWLHTDAALDVLLNFVKSGASGTCYVLGGQTKTASDGLTAVPDFQRSASFMVFVPALYEELFRSAIPAFQGNSSSGCPFPGGAEYNHISAAMLGPTKKDWSKVCNPLWSEKRRRKSCVSSLVSVYGSKLLRKLLDIKERADPSGLFKCYDCVGFYSQDSVDRPSGESSFPSTKKWCAKTVYNGGCMEYVDEDPAFLPEQRKARSEKLRSSIPEARPLLETAGA